jgi:tRNA nucleotidyltransferase (CCA-adding enzyme)
VPIIPGEADLPCVKPTREEQRGNSMDIAVTHINADFDALASLVAATFLYPGTVGVLPDQLQPGVRDFLAVHKDLFNLCAAKDVAPSEVTRIVVVDTNHWSRLGPLGELAQRDEVEVHLWDHHMTGGNIKAHWMCQEESGATITLMARAMRQRDCAFAPMQATLFLLGLYDDTGQLTYPSVTPEDAYAAGFFLEQGADLHVTAAYLDSPLDSTQTDILKQMLETSETLQVGGREVGVSSLIVPRGMVTLSSVVTKYKEISGMDAAFGVFWSDPDRCLVIGRGGHASLNVGAVMRRLGGGGHPGAGSAMVKGDTPESVARMVTSNLLREMETPQVLVRDIMSPPTMSIPPNTLLQEACRIMEDQRLPALLVTKRDELQGMVLLVDCRRLKTPSQLQAPVKGFMKRRTPSLEPGQTSREALRLMTETDLGLLPVVEGGRVLGAVTRADLMLHLYEL